ncbi:Magnesium chelatase, subunit ChlI C-terminal [Caldanaerobius fijiensis DSM 17918]|uniref:Magnesium chelatase, subunit ChlI C-terminal n=1 Tax=Caldanaerobius fijiensis DSM 17918 TaxID=1121256 RepID=A0A1M5C7M6_9THEO|nr:Magnesium chelatase, subunit ChlI C-terminal [Caldanaerobius fijiensis DSM 17918]
MLDRIDLFVEVPPVEYSSIADAKSGRSSAEMRKNVNRARQMQIERYKGINVYSNAQLSHQQISKYITLDKKSQNLLESAYSKMRLSVRSYYRILKVARTIADLEGSEVVRSYHVAEALQYKANFPVFNDVF